MTANAAIRVYLGWHIETGWSIQRVVRLGSKVLRPSTALPAGKSRDDISGFFVEQQNREGLCLYRISMRDPSHPHTETVDEDNNFAIHVFDKKEAKFKVLIPEPEDGHVLKIFSTDVTRYRFGNSIS